MLGEATFTHEPGEVQTTRRRPRGGIHPRVDGRGHARLGEG